MENIKSFLCHGRIKKLKRRNFFDIIAGTFFLCIIPLVYAIILQYLWISVVCIFVAISSLIVCIICLNKKTTFGKISILAVSSLGSMLNMTIMAVILAQMQSSAVFIIFAIGWFPIFFLVVSLLLAKVWINRGLYKNEKNTTIQKVKYSSIIGGILGVSIARFVLPGVSQDLALNIALLCSVMISCFFSMGTTNFLKLYYIKKYKLTEFFIKDDNTEVKTSKVKNAKEKLVIKIILILFVVLLIFLFSMFLIGLLTT